MTSWALHEGRCELWLPTLADRSVDLVLTDPPYAPETHLGARTAKNATIDTLRPLVDFAPLPYEDLRLVLDHCGRVARRWVVATLDWRHLAKLADDPPARLRFVRLGVWVCPNKAPQFSGDRPSPGWEAVGIFHTQGGKMRWNGGGSRAVWDYSKTLNAVHSTQKPLRLMRDLVRLFSDDGETICDPFAGSGTTGVAALLEGRSFVGAELDAGYAAVARERLARTQPEGTLAVPLFGLPMVSD